MHDLAPPSLPAGQTRRGIREELVLTRQWLPATEEQLHAHLDEAERWAASLPRTPDVHGLVHNDVCEDNLLWTGSEPVLIDFDDCCFTWYAADIARTLGSLQASDPERYPALASWLFDGYKEVRALDAVTTPWLPRFMQFDAVAGLAWSLHARSRGLQIEDASAAAEAHLRAVVAEPEAWLP